MNEKAGQAPAFFRKKIQKIFKKIIDQSITRCYIINVIKRGETSKRKETKIMTVTTYVINEGTKRKKAIPAYVVEMMKRSFFYYETAFVDKEIAEWCAAGYTIAIKKATPYKRAETLCKEVERLQKWVNKQNGGDCRIIKLPKETTNGDQYAIVTIFDPVMKRLEKYIHP